MNKQETAAVVILFLLLVGWGYLQRQKSPPPESPPPGAAEEETQPAPEQETALSKPVEPPVGETTEDRTVEETEAETAAAAPADQGHSLPEQTIVLSNQQIEAGISSWGGALSYARLTEYRETLDPESGAVVLDFGGCPALSLESLPGLSTNNDFTLSEIEAGRSVRIERLTDRGLRLERTITLHENYRFTVSDTFVNGSAETMVLPETVINLGPMQMIESKAKVRGMAYLGVDTMSSVGGEDVVHWDRKGPPGDKTALRDRFQPPARQGGCMIGKPRLTQPLPRSIEATRSSPTDWTAVKNKFFVQLLDGAEDAAGFALKAVRLVPEQEDPGNARTWQTAAVLQKVSVAQVFKECLLQPSESFTREYTYYVGPKKYSLLKDLGRHQDEVMQFGFFKPICGPLLVTLNGIHRVLPNYGVAIILLTVLVRVLFWPITHKSTESMKKMQEIQPLVNKVREKYKDKPQKMNQEVMALYREHKVNPMAGCLPMVIQIPVFIALFTVLRSAVELRFAPFLWIRDLSEPEGLLAGMIPLVGSLNILPLFMTGLTVLQQRMTPTSGDPQQQKMMMFMPVFFLFIFYNMPSALVLYWSTSQGLAVIQMAMQRRRKGAKSAGS